MNRRRPLFRYAALGVVLLLALGLRLRGIHTPLLDHPGWRQGDTAAIARNFATLDMNPLHPQADYNGAPPNYVELELQILPYLCAVLYKIFGVHEIFGRVISIAFSLATVATLGYFARALYASELAGLAAAFAFAVYPGSVYYGRTFMPDTTMTFFLSAALFAAWRWLAQRPPESRFGRRFWSAALLAACALLAKPVAAVAFVPIAALLVARRGVSGALRSPTTYAFFVLALTPYLLYDGYVRSIAEWRWASGITTLHVFPALRESFASFAALRQKLSLFRAALGMLQATMLGPVGTGVFVLGIAVSFGKPFRARTSLRPFLWAWLGAALAYAYVVVTVERVDYYLYPFLPLAALWTAALVPALADRFSLAPRRLQPAVAATYAVLAVGVCAASVAAARERVAPYYAYGKSIYRAAKALDATLEPGSLVVMGHYDPSILYYIRRKGWQEDPYLWTPFDEQSAIRKGARYFIAVEPGRLKRNVELFAWLQRFPLHDGTGKWPVYETDPAKVLPGAEERWREFRRRERSHALPTI